MHQIPESYHVSTEWSAELAQQLVEHSTEATIKTFTPRDATERFPSVEAANEWYKRKEPTLYALFRAASLAGIVWYSARSHPQLDATHTFAIRLYDNARGQGLARPFMAYCEEDFRAHTPDARVWLETDKDNVAARRLYNALGYKAVSKSAGRVTMLR